MEEEGWNKIVLEIWTGPVTVWKTILQPSSHEPYPVQLN